MNKFVLSILLSGLCVQLFPCLVTAKELSPKAIIYFDFAGNGEGQTDVQAVENAIRNAELNAASAGYGNCQLKRYSYYPNSGIWLASAVMTCSKDTSPPPPPPPPPVPDPPSISSPVIVGNSHIISWSAPGITRFALERSINGGQWSEIYKGSNTSWTAVSPSPATYRYRVKAITGAANSAYSAEVSIVVTVAPPPPPAPVPSVVGRTYTVSWGVSVGAVRYVLDQAPAGGQWIQVYDGPNTSWVAIGATMPPGTYRYRVKACSTGACSTYSAESVFVSVDITSIIKYLLDD